jgi:hypothetical protein
MKAVADSRYSYTQTVTTGPGLPSQSEVHEGSDWFQRLGIAGSGSGTWPEHQNSGYISKDLWLGLLRLI